MNVRIALLLPALALASIASTAQSAALAQSAAESIPADPGWPRTLTTNGVKLTVYQPQVDEWKNNRLLKARIAFVMSPPEGKPVVGVADLEGATTANIDTRTVLIQNLKITGARFPSLPEAEVTASEALLRQTFPTRSMTVSLDRLAASAQQSADAKPLNLQMQAPPIFISTRPSVLLIVDGKPVRAPIDGTPLEFVINTNWDLLYDPASSAYFLLSDKVWLTTTALNGPWAFASRLPDSFNQLPAGDQWNHVKSAIPPDVVNGTTVPTVYYSEQPAELIEFAGPPILQQVEGTRLMWVSNTTSWAFEDASDHQAYYLTSGRWFRAPKWEGPWSYAGNNLPGDFKLIRPDSAYGDVLASVPGTPEAEDAILLAQVPNEAVINRRQAEAKAIVSYDGDPVFAPIEGTQMSYATNTSSDVIQADNQCYLCQDAVWFSGPAAIGPWRTCLLVPPMIYTIPPSYPIYRVTYVRTEAGLTDDVVVSSYTAGYFGAYVAGVASGAALVWGTGWNYPSYVAWQAYDRSIGRGQRHTAWPQRTIHGRAALLWADEPTAPTHQQVAPHGITRQRVATAGRFASPVPLAHVLSRRGTIRTQILAGPHAKVAMALPSGELLQ